MAHSANNRKIFNLKWINDLNLIFLIFENPRQLIFGPRFNVAHLRSIFSYFTSIIRQIKCSTFWHKKNTIYVNFFSDRSSSASKIEPEATSLSWNASGNSPDQESTATLQSNATSDEVVVLLNPVEPATSIDVDDDEEGVGLKSDESTDEEVAATKPSKSYSKTKFVCIHSTFDLMLYIEALFYQ